MRKTLLVVLTTFALIPGFAAIASAAGKPAYIVTLKASTTSSVAGKFIVVAGKVTGPNAAGKTVTVQRKYLDGGWTNVAFPTIKSNGKFSARVETPQGGNTSFRAVKAKSSVRKAGVSPTRSTKVFEWLYLTHQPGFISQGDPFEATIGGKLYQHSFTFDEDGNLTYKTNGLCTKFSTRVAYDKPPASAPDALDVTVSRNPAAGPSVQATTPVATGATPTVNFSLVGGKYFEISVSSIEPTNYVASLGDPKVYCNASALPEFAISDV